MRVTHGRPGTGRASPLNPPGGAALWAPRLKDPSLCSRCAFLQHPETGLPRGRPDGSGKCTFLSWPEPRRRAPGTHPTAAPTGPGATAAPGLFSGSVILLRAPSRRRHRWVVTAARAGLPKVPDGPGNSRQNGLAASRQLHSWSVKATGALRSRGEPGSQVGGSERHPVRRGVGRPAEAALPRKGRPSTSTHKITGVRPTHPDGLKHPQNAHKAPLVAALPTSPPPPEAAGRARLICTADGSETAGLGMGWCTWHKCPCSAAVAGYRGPPPQGLATLCKRKR